jgi:hypothetical protein
MHFLDPDSFEAEGPGVSPEDISALGHAFIPCLLNRRARLAACSALTQAHAGLQQHNMLSPTIRQAGIKVQHTQVQALPLADKHDS